MSREIPFGWAGESSSGFEVRVGVVGGTFDPIHFGHLLIGEEARVRLDLEEVIFIPTGQPWMKNDVAISPPHHRLNMVRLATASNPFFHVSSLEIDRPGPTYSVDTLGEMHRQAGRGHEFFLILGADSLNQVHQWREPAKVLELCTLVAARRPRRPDLDMKRLAAVSESAAQSVVLLDGPLADISGTEIRRRVVLGLSVRYQVPEEVERYMYRYGLYRETQVSD